MEIYSTPVKVSGHTLFLSERPPTFKKRLEYNDYVLRRFIKMMKYENIETVVVLLTQRAIDNKYDGKLIDSYKESGLNVIHYPIRDFEVPDDFDTFHQLIQKISNALKTGNVLIHCGAGLGRTGTVAAGVAILKGFKPNAAILMIRKVRPNSIETKEQEDFLQEYYPYAHAEEDKE